MGGIVGQAELGQVFKMTSISRATAFRQFILIVIIRGDLIMMVVVDNNNTAAAVMITTVASRVIQLLTFVVC